MAGQQNLKIFNGIHFFPHFAHNSSELDIIGILIGTVSLLEPLLHLLGVTLFQLHRHQTLDIRANQLVMLIMEVKLDMLAYLLDHSLVVL